MPEINPQAPGQEPPYTAHATAIIDAGAQIGAGTDIDANFGRLAAAAVVAQRDGFKVVEAVKAR